MGLEEVEQKEHSVEGQYEASLKKKVQEEEVVVDILPLRGEGGEGGGSNSIHVEAVLSFNNGVEWGGGGGTPMEVKSSFEGLKAWVGGGGGEGIETVTSLSGSGGVTGSCGTGVGYGGSKILSTLSLVGKGGGLRITVSSERVSVSGAEDTSFPFCSLVSGLSYFLEHIESSITLWTQPINTIKDLLNLSKCLDWEAILLFKTG
nr:hypothetical protein Iba_chr08dCG14950 [Ipomoea batatas]